MTLLSRPTPDSLFAAAGNLRPIVWILDDSPMETAVARRALAPTYEVEAFLDGSVLLERMAAGPGPSVLVLDWQLPGMSGIEVCRFLRSTKNEMELPILMLTVFGHRSDLVDGLGAGANDYLTKPYDGPELVARVGTLARIQLLYRRTQAAEAQRTELLKREREARAEAEAANTAKDDFLAMVSHELRTPLNAILGWTRMVRAGALTKEQETRALATVERNATAQTQLIEDLLDISRMLSRKLTLETEPLDLVYALGLAVDAVRPTAATKAIELDVQVTDEGARMLGDPGRLQQVIGNLLTNSIKFTPRGGRVVLSLTRDDESLVMTVADTGQGIGPELLPRVFERFRQGDNGSKRAHGGLGLGLAIVKHIVELHGGTVEAKSPGAGLGATFTVRLPRLPDEEPAARITGPHGSVVQLATNRLEGLRVLVVDDDPDALELVAAMLSGASAVAYAASSAAQALALLIAERPDVLVSDLGMPGRDGYELIHDVRSLPATAGGHTPALALTAFARGDDRAHALAAGFTAYATKPIPPNDLVACVAELAGRFESQPSEEAQVSAPAGVSARPSDR